MMAPTNWFCRQQIRLTENLDPLNLPKDLDGVAKFDAYVAFERLTSSFSLSLQDDVAQATSQSRLQRMICKVISE